MKLAHAERCENAIFALQGHRVCDGGDGYHFQERREDFFLGTPKAVPVVMALQNGLRQLEAMAAPQSDFSG